MRLLGILAVIGMSMWLVVATFHRFAHRPYPLAWRVASVFLAAAGLAFGLCLVAYEYEVSPTVRRVGYPFAVGGYEFFGGRWLGGVSRLALFALAADILASVAICLLPLRVAQLLFERRFR